MSSIEPIGGRITPQASHRPAPSQQERASRIQELSKKRLQLEQALQNISSQKESIALRPVESDQLLSHQASSVSLSQEEVKKALEEVLEEQQLLSQIYERNTSDRPRRSIQCESVRCYWPLSFPYQDFKAHPEHYVFYRKDNELFAEKKGKWTWFKQYVLSNLLFGLWRDYTFESVVQGIRSSDVKTDLLLFLNQKIVSYNQKRPIERRITHVFDELLCAAIREKKKKLVSHLVENNAADLDNEGSPLIAALRSGQYDLVNLFNAHGVDLNRIGSEGVTPLTYAMEVEDEKAIQTMKQLGADEALADHNFQLKYGAALWGLGGDIVLEDSKGRPQRCSLEGHSEITTSRLFFENVEAFFCSDRSKSTLSEQAIHTLVEAFREARGVEQSLFERRLLSGTSFVRFHLVEPAHLISLVFHGGRCFLCNRGSGMTTHAIERYELDLEKVSEKSLDQLDEARTVEEIQALLKEAGAVHTGGIDQKPQKVGNCTWANIESAFFALLSVITEGSEHVFRKGEAKDLYKRFTSFARERWLENYLATSKFPNIPFLRKIIPKLKRNNLRIPSEKRRALQEAIETRVHPRQSAES